MLHLDLYRLSGPDELAELGFRDLAAQAALVIVEWPERAAADLAAAGLDVTLALEGDGRRAAIRSRGERGAAWLARLAAVFGRRPADDQATA